ncbi:MAG: hypothetical protein ACKV0T_18225 [Planctomycetales bacterium]
MAWLVAGLLVGLGVAYYWPQERAYANTVDRDSQFVMITVPVGTNAGAAGFNDPMDGVFILDFLSGQLRGAVLNRQTGRFASLYSRDLAKDFQVDPKDEPHYAIVSGVAQSPNQQGVQFASGIIYVAELSSGKLAAYAFPWIEVPRPSPKKYDMIVKDVFQWRQPMQKDK